MYKDLSLKEKAKVIREGVRLGLNSIDDILSLYDEAISHKFAEGSIATSDWDPINKIKLKYIQKKVLSAINLFGIEEVRQRAYNNIDPWGIYLNARNEFNRGIIKNKKPNYPMSYENPDEWRLRKGREKISDAIFAQYLQIPTQQRHFDYLLEQSSYKPTVGGNENDIYYSLPLDDETKQFLIDERFAPIYEYNTTALNKDNRGEKEIGKKNVKIGQNALSTILGGYNIGTHTIGRGYDKGKGEYVSYYDLWDLNPIKIEGGEDLSQGIGIPVKIYDRIYLDDYYGIGDKGGHATWLPEVTVTPNEYKKGGPIVSSYGQWKYPGKDTIIPSNNITMDYIDYPVLGVSDAGDTKVMMPWNNYHFNGSMVYEHPLIDHLALEGKKLNRQKISDNEYFSIMEKVALENNAKWNKDRKERKQRQLSVDEELVRLLNSNDYDYRGYYTKYPNSEANADTHWTDEFKTIYHPTFSNESRYSGIIDRNYNPYGYIGGSWGNNDKFIPAPWLLDNQYQLGGLAKPFSYGDIPDVRYLKGGNLFLGDNSKINKLNKRMHYSGGTGKFWGAVANNLFSKEDNYYNGTHYSGLYLSGRQEDLPQGRDHINLYTLGDETGFTRIDNATPITVNGNVYDYNLYEGKILPLDTIYLNPISQLPIDSMIEHKNLLGLDTDYFLMDKSYKQDYPKQYNNTWGYPNVHKGVVLDDTRKVSVSPKKDEKGDYYLDVFDIIDYGGTVGIGGNYIDNTVEKNGSGGPYILRLKVPVVFDAKKQSNGPLLNQLSSGNSTNTWEDYLMKYSPSYNAIVGNKVLPIEVVHTRSYGGNLFKKGGIYIKPSHRGRFTALKKRTGHSASWFKAHGTPALKKMATFALNSRHWNKHDEGGYLYSEGGFLLAPYLYVE